MVDPQGGRIAYTDTVDPPQIASSSDLHNFPVEFLSVDTNRVWEMSSSMYSPMYPTPGLVGHANEPPSYVCAAGFGAAASARGTQTTSAPRIAARTFFFDIDLNVTSGGLSSVSSMSLLFSPITFRGVEFKNRLWISPMCQYSAVDGVVNAWHQQWLGSLAIGGHGLVMTEATAVNPVGRHSLEDAGIWRDDHTTAWAPIVDFAHRHDAVIGMQLAHAGRKAGTLPPWLGRRELSADEGGWTSVGPSSLPAEHHSEPRPLTKPEIEGVVEDFARAARRAMTAGFDVLEIHSAHGYLLHEFLSPLSNERDDEYGGAFENRTRLTLEVLRAVRAEVGPNVPVFVRLSCTDYIDGGWTIDDTVRLSALLKDAGCDLIDCSSGGVAPIKFTEMDIGPGYQVQFAQAVREGASIATGAVGLITDALQAETILQDGKADVVFVARAAMRNPYFAVAAAEQLGEVIPWAPQLERARRIK